MTSVAVLIPVLARPQRVRPLVESIKATSSADDELEPFFLCSPGDDDEIAEVEAVYQEIAAAGGPISIGYSVMDWPAGAGDYARKMNLGFAFTETEWVFLAADDLVFHPGWLEAALSCHDETHACVIGTNDLGNSSVVAGRHSTHTLVHRDYGGCGTADEPDSGKLLHEGYDHNFVDVEFVETAMARETWAHAGDSIVEHLHPLWRKAEYDDTYWKGQRLVSSDRRLYQSRRRLWTAAA